MFTDVRGALRTARERLEYLSADPTRNALQAVKVLLKFLLLEHERVPLEGVGPLLSSIPLTTNANARYIGMEAGALVDWAIAGLLKAGAARVDGGALVNA
jgi:hypothetical protein